MAFRGHLRAGLEIAAVLSFAIVSGASPGLAADAVNGRKIATAKCQLCHGLDGQSKLPEAPNLSGQVEQYLVKQLDAFRAGERKNEMMSLVAPTLSESEVADLAAYYSAIEVKIGKLPGE